MRRFGPAKRVWSSLILSYAVTLLLPILIYLCVYFTMYGTMRRQIIQFQTSMLDQIRTEIDNELKEMTGFFVKASLDPNLSYLMSIPEEDRLYQSYDSMKHLLTLNQSLAMYLPTVSVIESYTIHLRLSGLIWYNSNIYDPQLFFGADVAPNLLSREIWDRCVSLPAKRNTILRYTVGETPQRSLIAVLEPLPLDSAGDRAFILCVLNEGRIREHMRSLSRLNQSRIYILGEDGGVLFSSEPDAPGILPVPDGLSESPDRIHEGRQWVSYYALSSVYPWRYVTMIPVSVFREKSRFMTITMLAGSILCLLAGALLILQLTRRSYNPVRELVALARQRSGGASPASGNEYQLIKDSFLDIARENTSLSERIRQQNLAIRANFLARLLKGRLGPSDLNEDILESLGIHFLSDRFLVMLCSLLPDAQEGESADRVPAFPGIQQFDAWFLERLRGNLDENWDVFATEVDEFHAYIVAVQEEAAETWPATLRTALAAAQGDPPWARLKPTFAVSRLQKSVTAIPHGYQEAMRAMEYRILGGRTGLIFADEVLALERNANQYRYSIEEEQILLNAIRVGDFGRASAEVERVLDDNLPGIGSSIGRFRCLIYDLIGTFIKALNQEHGMDELKFPDMGTALSQITAKPTIGETRRELLACLRTICEQTAVYSRDNERLALVRKVERFIGENYLDRNLGVAAISAGIGMNPKYLSTVYRTLKGESMMDTLHKRRLAEIKKLLRESSIKIGDAANRSGYSSVATLMRAFKKYEGITPGRFKGKE